MSDRRELLGYTRRTASGEAVADFAADREGFEDATFELDVVSVSGTLPELLVRIQQKSPNGGWHDIVAFLPVTVDGSQLAIVLPSESLVPFNPLVALEPGQVRRVPLSNEFRVVWTISGTAGAFNFGVLANFGRGIVTTTV